MRASVARLQIAAITRFQRENAQSAPGSKGDNEKMMPQAKTLNDDRDLPIGVTL